MVESDISYLEQEDLKDMGRLINKIIGKMPERYGTVLHLRDVEGYEMEEISQITGIDTATVRVILSRARKSVREKIIKLMEYGL
ncbi:MAG: sigma-70 family RNA polymerase sigma factor [Bacteroidaceae bacterium]|jgi:RNA polymerase sigma-70 factor (ECF subfamily)|nr:sigma-70 family RNA polymerase sigma factor [Bacteroidaceae bacterium]